MFWFWLTERPLEDVLVILNVKGVCVAIGVQSPGRESNSGLKTPAKQDPVGTRDCVECDSNTQLPVVVTVTHMKLKRTKKDHCDEQCCVDSGERVFDQCGHGLLGQRWEDVDRRRRC